MKSYSILTFLLCLFLQSCTAPEEKILKQNTVLFFDPLYYLSHYQGPCIEKSEIIECHWHTQEKKLQNRTDKSFLK
ncbi:hypothetical protein EBG57_23905 [Salmonella enterica]|nr:hypothetical protein [Salmonella enterica]EBV7220561.1 hypothetical protein [Salmonella enterica subsp. enterica serovar Oranienburg]EAP1799751.1 hypothetical protein [Salmonella enterica]EAP2761008.1 hypothetical protein [Salmonella enterica]EAP3949000.1 hypothetical protein [Salmonella enterica]